MPWEIILIMLVEMERFAQCGWHRSRWDPELYRNGVKERGSRRHLSFSASGPYFHRELESPFLPQVALHFFFSVLFILFYVWWGMHPCQATAHVCGQKIMRGNWFTSSTTRDRMIKLTPSDLVFYDGS